MFMADSTDTPTWSLRLPRDCSISAIRGVYDLIRDVVQRQDSLEIDCSAVDRADVTSIQLLVSTAKAASRDGRSVVLTDVSQALDNTFQRAGVAADALPPQDNSSSRSTGSD